jgi:hypothetical protein
MKKNLSVSIEMKIALIVLIILLIVHPVHIDFKFFTRIKYQIDNIIKKKGYIYYKKKIYFF